jgi:hypothetical protein
MIGVKIPKKPVHDVLVDKPGSHFHEKIGYQYNHNV